MHTNPDVLALRALGEDVGTAAERQHVTTCPFCSEEVAELARLADVGRSAPAAESLSAPSPEVWQRICAELGFSASGMGQGGSSSQRVPRPAPSRVRDIRTAPQPLEPVAASPAPRGSTPRRLAALLVAAALALVVGIGVGIGYERQVVQPQRRVIARADLTASPKWSGATGTAEVMADGRGGRTLVLQMSTPQPVPGTRVVWLMDPSDNERKQMGVMTDGQSKLEIPLGMSLFKFPVVDVSDEPVDDPAPGQHSGDTIVRGELE